MDTETASLCMQNLAFEFRPQRKTQVLQCGSADTLAFGRNAETT
jgi:hypothetical protein